jgi:hypothetical protein
MFDWTVETPLPQVIGEAVGAASMCWEFPEKAGVFQSEKASQIVDEVMEIIHRKTLRIE